MPIRYTEFAGPKITQGTFVEKSLQEFVAHCGASFAKKTLQPLCVPDALPGNSRASGVVATAATAIFLDFDKPTLSMDEVAARLGKRKAEFVLYPTYSWTEQLPRYRVVLPFAKFMAVAARTALVARIGEVLPGIASETTDTKRGYFVGCNGNGAPPVQWGEGKPAEQVKWPKAPAASPAAAPLKGNPGQLAKDLVRKLGRPLRDSEGRFSAVEYLATRVSARAYSEEQCYALLDALIAKYFDPSDVTDEDRVRWESRIAYWLEKDGKRRIAEPRISTIKAKLILPSFGLADALAFEDDRKYLIQNYVITPGALTFSGTPKKGKTYLLLQWAVCQALGLNFIGFDLKALPVLYWDNENGTKEIMVRIKRILRQLHPETLPAGALENLDVISFTPDSALPRGAEGAAALEARVKERKAKLVIIDGLMGMGAANEQRGNPNRADYEAIRSWQVLAHKLDCTIILMLPDRKMSAGQGVLEDKVSGTRGVTQASDGNLFLEITALDGVVHAALTGGVRGGSDMDLGLRRDDAISLWTHVGRSVDVLKQKPHRVAILKAIAELKDKAIGLEIARHLRRDVDATNQLLRRMKSDGQIVRNKETNAWEKFDG